MIGWLRRPLGSNRRRLASTLVLLSLLAWHGRAAARPQSSDVASVLRTHLNEARPPLSVMTAAAHAELTALYDAEGYTPLWTDADHRISGDAREALALIASAPDDGLDAGDYYESQLDQVMATLDRSTRSPLASELAAFDVALTAGMLRYLHDLRIGRVDPQTISFGVNLPADHYDVAAQLRSALSAHRVAAAAAELRPVFAQYDALRVMLRRYRSLAAGPVLEPLPSFTAPVKPGQAYAGVGALRRRLAALGDLPSQTPPPATPGTYQDALVEAVKRFQVRHGLEGDGVLGAKTSAALNVPLAWRARQVELALERLRWLPPLESRSLVINIPMFRMWTWDAGRASPTPSLSMAVIVGRALTTQTPVMVEEMREVIFRPYWNVPRSILRHEILPVIERDPDYLRRQDMEIVRGDGDAARPVAATAENIARLRHGALRVRQRPGPRNALGLIKFVFPNAANVYLHGTPAPALFGRTRRDFSHGCVRVEDPVALAEWVLRDQPEWTRERVLAAMAGTRSISVNLAHSIQVVLFYTTAAVMPEDGTIRFADDIYGHDAKLQAALLRRRLPALTPES